MPVWKSSPFSSRMPHFPLKQTRKSGSRFSGSPPREGSAPRTAAGFGKMRTFDAGGLKERLQALGTDAAGDPETEERAALAFADWLEANGDGAWASYIRVRCSLDGKAPGDDYPDLLEQFLERGAAMRPRLAQFEGFYFSGY